MKTAAVLILTVLIMAMVPGCSVFSGKDPGDISGSNGNGSGIVDGYPSEENGPAGENSNENSGSQDSSDTEDKEDSENKDAKYSVEERLARMSLDEKIGQMFIIGVEGASADEKLKQSIATLKPGGIILFRDNIKDPEQLLSFTNALKAANNGRTPLFISIDEEGGRISRMPKALPVCCPPCL